MGHAVWPYVGRGAWHYGLKLIHATKVAHDVQSVKIVKY